MPWTRSARVNETIDYIHAYVGAGLSQTLRDDICTMIALRYPRTTAVQRQAFNTLADAMSVKAAIPNQANRGNVNERKMRRAVMLIWSSMGALVPNPAHSQRKAAEAMTALTATLPTKLNEAMRLASVMASDAGAANLFNTEFAGNPLGFIRNNRIMIYGTPEGGDLLKNKNNAAFTNALTFEFVYSVEHDRFEFWRTAPTYLGGRHVITAVSVPAVHWSEVPDRGTDLVPTAAAPAGFGSLLGINVTGANWMITTQFTGCSFVYSTTGPFYAAHLTPALRDKPILTAHDLAGQLMGNVGTVAGASFHNFPNGQAANVRVFGPGVGNIVPQGGGNPYYPPKVINAVGGQMKWMCIFGRLHNGSWELYTQAIDGTLAIMEARRIR